MMRDTYELERKILRALEPHILKKPTFVVIFWPKDGSIRLQFSYIIRVVEITLSDIFHFGCDAIYNKLPDYEYVEVEWPNKKDFDRLDTAYINKRMGYILINPNVNK